MERHHLGTELLYSACILACNRIIVQREKLNSINFYPVADGDTGDNMASTAYAIIHHSQKQPSLKATMQAISNAAISGARGNSGMIFSQFFNGMAEHLPSVEELDTHSFAKLINSAVVSVRQAILNPVEGTILTVMEAWASAVVGLAEHYSCFVELLNQSLSPLNQALKKTSQQLHILREANVVDAGALGFYHFISGFVESISKGNIQYEAVKKALPAVEFNHQFADSGAPPQHRYCCEAMLKADAVDKKILVNYLQDFGDSVVLSGNQELCRFHVHSNNPEVLFTELCDYGVIQEPKVDDMLRQFEVNHQKKYNIALVTDSSANLPQALIDQYQIHLIPLNIFLDDHHLLDMFCIQKDAFYSKLNNLKKYPTTSLPNLHKVRDKMDFLARHYDHVLVLSLSQALSGTHDVMVKSADPYPHIHVVNSKHTAGSLGLLVQYVAKLIEQQHEIEFIKEQLLQQIEKTYTFVVVDQFDSLMRSGRVSKFSAHIARIANIKPVLSLNQMGQAILSDKAFSYQKGLIKILNKIEELKRRSSLVSYNIIHADCPEKAEAFAELTTKALGCPPEYIDTAASVIGLHAGRGCIALSALFK